jgi:dihydrodipicolinate synthase/N-acetylneuraminate lyase
VSDGPLRGVLCPIVTPLRPDDESLDCDAMSNHLDALVPHLDGLLVLGTSGEHPWLDHHVEDQVVRLTGEVVGGRCRILVGAGQAGYRPTLKRLDRIATLPADYVVITPPTYFPLSDASLATYFERLADRSPVPLILYNIPQHTTARIPVSVVQALAGHPNIAGIKDSAGDMTTFVELLKVQTDGFRVLQGRDHMVAESSRQGCAGVITALANLAPRLVRQVLCTAQAAAGHHRSDLAEDLDRLAAIFHHGYWLSALKCAVDAAGYQVGRPSSPLPPLTPEQEASVRQIIAVIGERGWLIDRP